MLRLGMENVDCVGSWSSVRTLALVSRTLVATPASRRFTLFPSVFLRILCYGLSVGLMWLAVLFAADFRASLTRNIGIGSSKFQPYTLHLLADTPYKSSVQSSHASNLKMPNALVPVADGSEDIETVSIIDVLRRAKVEVTVASVMEGGRTQVKLARGCSLIADDHIDDCVDKKWDLIALPGGMPGAEHLRDSKALISLLQKQKEEGRIFAAICASPVVVFHTHGLINGHTFTSYPAFRDKIDAKTSDYTYSEQRVVESGSCITSRGPGTAIEFAVTLVKHLCGEQTAKQVETPLLAAQSVL